MIFQRTPLVVHFLKALTKEGFIYGCKPVFYQEKYVSQMKYIQVFLKYFNNDRVIQLVVSYSKLQLFKYCSLKYFTYLNQFSPFALLNTTAGFKTFQQAQKMKLGGILVFLSL